MSEPAQRLSIPPRLWLAILLGCVVVAALDATQMALQGLLGESGKVRWQNVVFQGSEWLILAALTPIIVQLARRFPLRAPRLAPALLIHALGAAILCLLWATSGVLLRRSLGDAWFPSFRNEWMVWSLITIPWSFILYFALLGTLHSFSYYLHGREQEIRAMRLSSQLSDARLSALRAQLHPHFLFNTLNAIGVLLRDQRVQLAAQMLDGLGDLLRDVLRSDRAHEIPLAHELELVEKYLAIEQIRFSDRLQVIFRIEPSTRSALVPPFILQPLVENALRHGLAERVDAALVEIGAQRKDALLELWVRDNGPGIVRDIEEGIGLTNVRDRLRTLYGESAAFTLEPGPGEGVVARIQLPWKEAT